jgi:hypothetical protein
VSQLAGAPSARFRTLLAAVLNARTLGVHSLTNRCGSGLPNYSVVIFCVTMSTDRSMKRARTEVLSLRVERELRERIVLTQRSRIARQAARARWGSANVR